MAEQETPTLGPPHVKLSPDELAQLADPGYWASLTYSDRWDLHARLVAEVQWAYDGLTGLNDLLDLRNHIDQQRTSDAEEVCGALDRWEALWVDGFDVEPAGMFKTESFERVHRAMSRWRAWQGRRNAEAQA